MLVHYLEGETRVEAIAQELRDRDEALRQLKFNLQNAQEQMKHFADKKRRAVHYDIGDWVFLKSRPHRQHSVVRRIHQKLSPRFFGPFQIIQKIGQVAYKLQLPVSSKIHPIFHVSQLKKAVGNYIAIPELPASLETDKRAIIPARVLSWRDRWEQGQHKREWLIQWEGMDVGDATWEEELLLKSQFPDLSLEDKASVEGGGDDRKEAETIDNEGEIFNYLINYAVASSTGVLGVLALLAWFLRRRFISNKNSPYQIIELFLKNHGHLAAKRYTYTDIKKATNSFKNKLGHGGYGSVYKGKLQDGSLVAVKILSESNGNGEEFINEVASISVTSHVNIVSLLGFCLEGSKRALIYDYMPNGSLEKFINEDKDPLKLSFPLSCNTIYNIAIGVARGLEYLHKGCNTKILHFDIKPHNILLDGDFCPKISDFGLAKVCARKEMFSRNFGSVSHKSDVYSYGMMVLEMVGGKHNNNMVDDERSSEIYFPHWIYKRLELNQEPRLQSNNNKFDKQIVRKMIIVSLWCIQTDPSHRPEMSKVVEMMEGSLESLQIPPKPFLSSPPRPPSESSDCNTYTYTSHDWYPSGTLHSPYH
ncbi:PR5-like receptor kinase [Vicia villosa]|uniref:PR5-like receptor kinase n=1 Tax=Vicia villosa TaxID=3911 RepID=UPI00273B24EC|nr:PR5-like receptor kinase [Vicia villosa]